MALIDRDQLTAIGRVSGAHGMDGELKVAPLTDEPGYYQGVNQAFLDGSHGLTRHQVAQLSWRGAFWLMRLAEVKTRQEAETLKGALLLLEPEQLRPLEEGEYFLHDLIGCQVATPQGALLGVVEEIMEAGAQGVLVVRREGHELLLPMVEQVVLRVDVAQRQILADPSPELLALND